MQTAQILKQLQVELGIQTSGVLNKSLNNLKTKTGWGGATGKLLLLFQHIFILLYPIKIFAISSAPRSPG